MNSLVEIREYKNGDEKGIIPLFNDVFKADRNEEYWHWQFMENPAKEPVIIVAEDDSKIVGQSTLLPTKMTIKGEELFSGQSIDTMVSKDYRRQGIYEKMAFDSYDIGRDKGIEFGFRFPSKPALEGALKKLDGTLVEEIPLFMNAYRLDNFLTAIVKIRAIAKILAIPIQLVIKTVLFREKRIKIKENYEMKEIDDFNEDFDELWLRLKDNAPIMSKRDRTFLNWRIKNHPTNQYKTIGAYLDKELVGYIVLKIEERKLRGTFKASLGSIVDIIGVNEDVLAALYYKAKEYFKKEKTDFVVVWATSSMKYRELFTKLGFFKSKSTVPFVVKDFTEDKKWEDIITQEKNWYLMPIESDFY